MFSKILAFFAVCAAVVFLASAGEPDTSYQTSAPFYSYSLSDTITNTENDTIDIPARLVSDWSGGWHVQATSLSGTVALANTVEESLSYNGTDWVSVDTINHVAAGTRRMEQDRVYGFRQRIVIDGSGTQSTRYTVYFVAKKD
jgi:hypothetical protein